MKYKKNICSIWGENMNDSSMKTMQMILQYFQKEADELVMELHQSSKELKSLDSLIEEKENNYSVDEYVFSPRSDKSITDEITTLKGRLYDLTKKHEKIQEKYDQINYYIEQIVNVLSCDVNKPSNLGGLAYQEQDRQRIARDLHSSSLQSLSFIVEKLDAAVRYVDSDPMKAKMEISMAKKNLADCLDNIRSVIHDLQPMILDASCFKDIINKLIERINGNNELNIESEINDLNCKNQIVLVTIYRLIEECLINIKKHANAYQVNLIIQEQVGYYYIYVEDDGKGFDLSSIENNLDNRFGINIMKERVKMLGGSITIDSAFNSGTRIKILIPCE